MAKDKVVAAGAVLWRKAEDGAAAEEASESEGVLSAENHGGSEHPSGLEIYLIHRPRYDDWSFPKGKQKKDEPLRLAAVREVFEETGYQVALGLPLPSVHYTLPSGKRKVVHYWASRVLAADDPALVVRPEFGRAKHAEVDSGEWMPLESALERLTRKDDRKLLQAFADRWREAEGGGEVEGGYEVSILVRHARAKKRSVWKDGEATRPLTKQGADRAERIAELLSLYGVSELHSSPWERCVATLRPYADQTGLDLHLHDDLTEASFRADADATAAQAASVLFQRGSVCAVCGHRPTLGAILGTLSRSATKKVAEHMPRENPWLKTGECLVLHHRDGTIVEAELVRPLAS